MYKSLPLRAIKAAAEIPSQAQITRQKSQNRYGSKPFLKEGEKRCCIFSFETATTWITVGDTMYQERFYRNL